MHGELMIDQACAPPCRHAARHAWAPDGRSVACAAPAATRSLHAPLPTTSPHVYEALECTLYACTFLLIGPRSRRQSWLPLAYQRRTCTSPTSAKLTRRPSLRRSREQTGSSSRRARSRRCACQSPLVAGQPVQCAMLPLCACVPSSLPMHVGAPTHAGVRAHIHTQHVHACTRAHTCACARANSCTHAAATRFRPCLHHGHMHWPVPPAPTQLKPLSLIPVFWAKLTGGKASPEFTWKEGQFPEQVVCGCVCVCARRGKGAVSLCTEGGVSTSCQGTGRAGRTASPHAGGGGVFVHWEDGAALHLTRGSARVYEAWPPRAHATLRHRAGRLARPEGSDRRCQGRRRQARRAGQQHGRHGAGLEPQPPRQRQHPAVEAQGGAVPHGVRPAVHHRPPWRWVGRYTCSPFCKHLCLHAFACIVAVMRGVTQAKGVQAAVLRSMVQGLGRRWARWRSSLPEDVDPSSCAPTRGCTCTRVHGQNKRGPDGQAST